MTQEKEQRPPRGITRRDFLVAAGSAAVGAVGYTAFRSIIPSEPPWQGQSEWDYQGWEDLYRKEWLLLRRALLQPSVRRYLEVGVFKLGCFRAAGEILKKKAGSQMVGVDLFDLGHLSRSLTTVNQTHIGGSVDYEAALRLMVPYPFAELIRADSSGALRLLREKARFNPPACLPCRRNAASSP